MPETSIGIMFDWSTKLRGNFYACRITLFIHWQFLCCETCPSRNSSIVIIVQFDVLGSTSIVIYLANIDYVFICTDMASCETILLKLWAPVLLNFFKITFDLMWLITSRSLSLLFINTLFILHNILYHGAKAVEKGCIRVISMLKLNRLQ